MAFSSTIAEARDFLNAFQVFYEYDKNDPLGLNQTINLNDTFAWGCADSEFVADDEMMRLAELAWDYGFGGILYWVAIEKRKWDLSCIEFENTRRRVEFVIQEEAVKERVPDYATRAYTKCEYMIGTLDR